MAQQTCPDCGDEFHKCNGFQTDRGVICRECGTDPNNPNNSNDMPALADIEIQ